MEELIQVSSLINELTETIDSLEITAQEKLDAINYAINRLNELKEEINQGR